MLTYDLTSSVNAHITLGAWSPSFTVWYRDCPWAKLPFPSNCWPLSCLNWSPNTALSPFLSLSLIWKCFKVPLSKVFTVTSISHGNDLLRPSFFELRLPLASCCPREHAHILDSLIGALFLEFALVPTSIPFSFSCYSLSFGESKWLSRALLTLLCRFPHFSGPNSQD